MSWATTRGETPSPTNWTANRSLPQTRAKFNGGAAPLSLQNLERPFILICIRSTIVQPIQAITGGRSDVTRAQCSI